MIAAAVCSRAQLDVYKSQAKKIIKNLNSSSARRLTCADAPAPRHSGPADLSQLLRLRRVDSGACHFHYISEYGVCFLCLTERAYPKRLAYKYLEELQSAFNAKFRDEIESATRPVRALADRPQSAPCGSPPRAAPQYAFIKFDPVIQRTKRLYVDTRAQQNLSKLNEDLADVQKIMTQNIQEVLDRGERLDTVMSKSSNLREASGRYAKTARYLNTQALLRKYGPVLFVALLIFGGLYLRFR